MENNNCSINVNGIKKFKLLHSCPRDYSKCTFFDAKSECNCVKEDAPGNCVRKEKLIKDAMKLLNIDEKDALEVIEVFYEDKAGGKV